jgi:hypothetical protein
MRPEIPSTADFLILAGETVPVLTGLLSSNALILLISTLISLPPCYSNFQLREVQVVLSKREALD